MSVKMNRSRLTRLLNEIRNETAKRVTENSQDFDWVIKFNTNASHMADRIMDRTNHNGKTVELVKDMLYSVADHYLCNVVHFAHKTKDSESIDNLILYRVVDGKIFAIPSSVRMFWSEEIQKYIVSITARTIIPKYLHSVKGRSIKVDFVPPKILFEYTGFRLGVSKLTKMIESDLCPDSLKVLRFR